MGQVCRILARALLFFFVSFFSVRRRLRSHFKNLCFIFYRDFQKLNGLELSSVFSCWKPRVKHKDFLKYYFSNLLIIYEVKKTERRLGHVILLIIIFGEILLWMSLRIINILRGYSKQYSHSRYPNTSKLVKKLGCTLFCQPTSQYLDIWWNTLPYVWYIP